MHTPTDAMPDRASEIRGIRLRTLDVLLDQADEDDLDRVHAHLCDFDDGSERARRLVMALAALTASERDLLAADLRAVRPRRRTARRRRRRTTRVLPVAPL